MRIGIPKEIKDNENRVGLMPAGAAALIAHGHQVVVQAEAGTGSGIPDSAYAELGADIAANPAAVYGETELIIKVKEPLATEYPLIRAEHILFTFFHFAASRDLTDAMLASGAICIAYETIEDEHGHLPLLVPMSEVAGRMAVHEGAKCLEKPMLGRGILLGGVPGVSPASVVILGGGVVGANAAKMAAGLGAQVTILDVNLERLRYLDDIMPNNVTTLMSNPINIRDRISSADLVIGAVLIEGAKAPRLITRDMLALMKPGSVVIDVAIDQGGCIETGHPTTHSQPTYVVDGVVHYCVANMPGAVAGTSTPALTNATFPYALRLADAGIPAALEQDRGLAKGINIARGRITFRAVAEAFGMECATLAAVGLDAS